MKQEKEEKEEEEEECGERGERDDDAAATGVVVRRFFYLGKSLTQSAYERDSGCI